MNRVEPLFEWLVDGCPGAATAEEVIERVGHDIRAAAVPVDRIGIFVTTLHPNIIGRAFWWEHGKPLRLLELTIELQRTMTANKNPVARVSQGRQELRARLSDPAMVAEFPVFAELVAGGYTDVVYFPIVFLRGETHVITFATKDEAGFSDPQIEMLRDIVRPLARVTEIFAQHRTAANLLSTYVGRNSGEKILAGRIFKGDIEAINAVIWFSDLRGFTERTARQTPRETIDMLNALFECQVPSIHKHNGEILKFIGDGLLAIFPYDSEASVKVAAESALAAADEAFAAHEKQNEGAKEPTKFGLALHVGEIAYGNIGGASRLDFTAIGPAVNIAARLEGLTATLGRRLVISSELAKHVTRPLDPLGEFPLKGVPNPQQVFGLK